ncbi:GumC family protein [Henriciella aquimarina]|uniref:GumC family protein n=1 Tax=Henriciella aquimarina TaxID=545261 RepID=UPI00117A2E6B|nr:polysaccharide biosynthesis tyrosine autokinase [Henriciella aquimarina]
MNSQLPIDSRYANRPYYFSESGAGDEKITDPKQALRALRRRLALFLFVVVSVFLAVAVYTFQATPVYSTSASVIIDSRDKTVVDIGSVMSGLPPESTVVDTEVEIIRSRSLAEKVVRQLNLTKYPEFNPMLREPSLMASVKGQIKDWLTKDPQPTPGSAASPADEETKEMELVVSELLAKTSARRIGTTYGIQIYANSHDPELAAAIANKIVDQYFVEQLDAKFDATRRANAWLEDRLSELRNEVNAAEAAVETYRAQSGLISAGTNTLNEQQMSDLNAQLIVQRAELAEAEARLDTVRELAQQGLSAEVSGQAMNSPVISELRNQQAEILRERADLQNRYGPKHPEIERINKEEANIREQIQIELRRIVSNIEGDVAIARKRVNSLESNLGRMRSTLAQNNQASVRLRELERNAEASRSIYEAFLARFKQTNDSEGLAEPDARLLSSAPVPRGPSFPKTSLNLAIGIVLGLMLGVGSVIAAEALNSQIASGDEIEEHFRVPFLGNFPRLTGTAKKDPRAYLIENPTSAYAESFRNLRASIMFADLDSPVKTVAITSSQPDEGKTTMTQGLGLMSAMSGTKTLIIDGDFRRRRLSAVVMDEDPERGFLECLFGECTVEEAVQVDEETGLHILPLTASRHTPRDVFGSKAFDQLMEQLEDEYDFIIVDTGPLLLLAETRVLTSKVDQVVIVSRWLKTNRAALKQTLSILREFRARIAGVVINRVDTNKYHRQGYGHSGYKSYAKYYTQG